MTKWVLTKWVFCGFEIIKLFVHVLVGMLECVPVTYVYTCPIHTYLATDNKNITSARPLSVAAGFINGLGYQVAFTVRSVPTVVYLGSLSLSL